MADAKSFSDAIIEMVRADRETFRIRREAADAEYAEMLKSNLWGMYHEAQKRQQKK